MPELISVYSFYNHAQKLFSPKVLIWKGQQLKVDKIGYHHSFRSGRILYHIFSVQAQSLFFRLSFNTESLSWEVSEVCDEKFAL